TVADAAAKAKQFPAVICPEWRDQMPPLRQKKKQGGENFAPGGGGAAGNSPVKGPQMGDLRERQGFRCEVNGLLVELRVLGEVESEGSSILEYDSVLDAWVVLPKPTAVAFAQSRLREPKLPALPDIPNDEES